MGRTSYFLKVTAERPKDPSRTQQLGKSRQMVCAARACARPGFAPPLPLRVLLLVPGPRSRTRVRGRVRRTPARPPAPPPRAGRSFRPTAAAQLSSAGREVSVREVPSSWQRNRGFVPVPDTYLPDAAYLAMVRDARSSPFYPVSWCAGAVVYMSSTVQFCALPWKGRLVSSEPSFILKGWLR